ncbi:type II toxin-antitoxin system RelE/ParE family toxin [Williamsia sp. CHRR-6]|uniref:type II toxin-antitoxin system RelE family toxin n=1 Tax=Williamsia sp. CHRR-6 TaxID=2835871 RepID=UPI001BDAC672|nr:type II toxin-antitoxin system RelE/ParE family toxin [Williamsia sp. CHRR-6]
MMQTARRTTPSPRNSPRGTSESRDIRRHPHPDSRQALSGIEKRDRLRIEGAIALLAETPRPFNATKMVCHTDKWRIRIGDCRVLSAITKECLTILVIHIAHRLDVYR